MGVNRGNFTCVLWPILIMKKTLQRWNGGVSQRITSGDTRRQNMDATHQGNCPEVQMSVAFQLHYFLVSWLHYARLLRKFYKCCTIKSCKQGTHSRRTLWRWKNEVRWRLPSEDSHRRTNDQTPQTNRPEMRTLASFQPWKVRHFDCIIRHLVGIF